MDSVEFASRRAYVAERLIARQCGCQRCVMVIVHGSVVIRDGSVDPAIALSLEHVRRSRAEPGCIAHGVHRDCENPSRLVFVEAWVDRAALEQHFQVPASRRFVAELAALALEPPTLTIYDAERLGR